MRRIINEPTAAALAYGLDKKADEKIAVFDLGGGTYDISILELGDGVFEVKATNGDTHLGGDDFDQRLINWLVEEFRKDQGIDLSADPMALQRLKEAAEKAKIELSSTMQTDINLPFITADQSGPKHLNLSLTRAKFEQLVDDLIQRTIPPMEKALADAGLSVDEIDEVILVGGSTRIPKIQDVVKDFFEQDPHKGVNPDEVVGIGAAIQGGGPRWRREGRPPPRRHAALARDRDAGRGHDVAHRAQHDDPDQEVGDLLDGGGQPEHGRHPRPAGRAQDGARQQDDRPLPAHGHPARAAGSSAGSEVTFDIDANGILHVSAQDKATGKEQKIRIEASSGLSDAEIERMVRDAESHAAEDQERREVVEARNRLDSLVYQTEKNLEDWKETIDDEGRDAIEATMERGRAALKQADHDEVVAATTAIQEAVGAAAQKMYAAAGMGGGAGPEDMPGGEAGGGDPEVEVEDAGEEEVVEADYEIVEESEDEE